MKRRQKKYPFLLILSALMVIACQSNPKQTDMVNTDNQLSYCDSQIRRTLTEIAKDSTMLPRSIDTHASNWQLINCYDWTSGFWPGILWYNYESTGCEQIEKKATLYTENLKPLLNEEHSGDHDLGFQIFCSFGNAYRLTKEEEYKKILLDGAEKLSKMYNPKVGTILSWAHMVKEMGWPHNTIMDNMMNLEILFWASKNGGDKKYYDIALSHAKVTKENQFREDGSCYHVAIYDTLTGKFIKGVTNQGISDESMWSRGQAWAIYGYTMVYRETKEIEYLRFAEKVTDVYLKRLPDDYVPFWDFDDPTIPNAPRDASAAAIAASALLELSELEDNKEKAEQYKVAAEKMIINLSSEKYKSGKSKPSFLVHCTGNYPSGYEIDASINYADYYYIEALLRYKKMEEGLLISQNLIK
jgi:unsaturated chondroitin disaccharide hydrolase